MGILEEENKRNGKREGKETSHKGGQKEDVGWRDDRPRCRDSPLFVDEPSNLTGTESF